MKNYIIITTLILLTLTSCGPFAPKNEYGMARLKSYRFRIKPNDNHLFLNIVDTTAFYKEIKIDGKDSLQHYKISELNNGFKFYKNGRVAFLKSVKLEDSTTLNPKKALMGYYNYNNDGFYIESVFSLVSTYSVSTEKIILHKSNKDTLVIKTYKSVGCAEKTSTYIREKINNDFLIYKPDW